MKFETEWAMSRFLLITFLAVGSANALAQDDRNCRVLPEEFNTNKEQQMMRAFLRHKVHAALDRRLREWEAALESPEELASFQEKRREFLRWTLGEMPERTPLSPQVTGTIREDGFRIDNVLFESQPGFHVTANLYRPDGPGPFPAVLHPCGHSENGKAAEVYQKANRLLARNGFIVLCYDPIGQGERKQIFASNGKPAHRASGEHQQLGVAPILLGRSLASYMVWDGVRGIDYLCSRPDVDSRRIGCTGNSGGGNMTSYLMAYDDRIAAAAPGCFMTTHRRKNESPGPGDAEQNLFAQIREGFDHPDFILVRAPKPTLILSATQDYVPIEGTWEAFRQAKRTFTRLGYPERVGLIETNAKHGYSRPLREGAVRFFARWLQGRQIEVFETEDVHVRSIAVSLRKDAELQVTTEGQVRKMKDERSIFDLYAEYEGQLAARRPQLTREIVRKVTGIRPLSELPKPKLEGHGTFLQPVKNPAGHESTQQKLIFHPEPGIVLPALYWPAGDGEPHMIAHDAGMNAAVAKAERLHDRGHPVLLVDVRDIGETRTRNWRFFGADYYIAYMLGRCWLGMRTEDLLICARWLAEKENVKSIRLTAHGEIGPAALHAAALEPKLISAVHSQDGLTSWRELMTSSETQTHLHNAVQNALRYYDLPDLIDLAGKDRMSIDEPVAARGTIKSATLSSAQTAPSDGS